MIKQYVFRLEPVLKLRKLKEENCRTELGQLLMELNKIEDQLIHDKNQIENYYKIQDDALQKGVKGGQVQAFPMLIEGKSRNIKLLERDREKQEKLVAQKKQELAILKGEMKVMENLKQKYFDEHRLAANKEMDKKIEEQTQLWLEHKEK